MFYDNINCMKKYISENDILMKEWDYDLNADLDPTKLTYGSNKKVWWKCSKGHTFEQSIEKRTRRNNACPYCSGHKVLAGFNDLATINPKIAEEWHSTKNGNLTPKDVTAGSGKKVWWECVNGHEYQSIIRDRNYGAGCPICRLRRTTSFAEQSILFYTQQLYPDTISKYQKCFENSMEIDIYIPSLKIGIEYDGAAWHKTEEHYKREVKKYQICKEKEIYLIRIKEEVKNQKNVKIENVADKIFYLPKVKRNNLKNLEKVIKLLVKEISVNTNIDINLNRDKYLILNYVYKISNSLDELRPDVSLKWNYDKNKNLKPNMFSVSSNEIVWWKCPDCGYEWESSINHMTRKGTYGCPICANKQSGISYTKGVVKKVGSLADTMPELAKQWHPTKNGDLTPKDITAGRAKPVWWLCPTCGYEWQASPNNRKKGVGCPCCSGRVAQKGVNDLSTTHPQIAKEWNYTRNIDLKPDEFKAGSGHKVWWICSTCGNEYQATIKHRTDCNKPTGCPICGHKKGAKSYSFPVKMFNINNNQLIKTFNSISEASRIMHITTKSISDVCKGIRKEAGGYAWEYLEKTEK